MKIESISGVVYPYCELLTYFLNSRLIPRDCDMQEDINMLLISPIKSLQALLNSERNNFSLSKEAWANLMQIANEIWYAYEQRTDIRDAVGTKAIIIPEDLIQRLLEYYKIPFNTPVDFALIAQLSGMIWKELEDKSVTEE